MRFDSIRIGAQQLFVDLPIRGAQISDPFIIKGVEGLGPSEVDLHIKRTLNSGGIRQASRPRYKNIDLLVKLNPDHTHPTINTAGDLRDQLYYLMTPVLHTAVTLSLQTLDGATVASIKGHIGRMTPNPFSKDPEVQINISCLQPYLYGPGDVVLTPVDVPDWDSAGYTKVLPLHVGTAPAWSLIEVELVNNTSVFNIGHLSQTPRFEVAHTLLAGDKIRFQQAPGNRYVTLIRGGVGSSIIGSLSSTSTWWELFPGVENSLGSGQAFKLKHVQYTPQYQGV